MHQIARRKDPREGRTYSKFAAQQSKERCLVDSAYLIANRTQLNSKWSSY